MKSDFNEILVFVATARAGSFSKAADRLGVPKSYVSRKIASLEERLSLRLFERTTRSVQLTEHGSTYFSACEQAVSTIEETERKLEHGSDSPSGRVRLTCPVEFGPTITQVLSEKFLKHFPDVQLEIIASNKVLNFIDDQIDVAIRPMHLADPSMKFVKLADITWGLYASSSWLHANRHSLKSIEDIRSVDLIAFHPSSTPQKKWTYKIQTKSKKIEFTYNPRFIASNLSTLLEAVRTGAGVATLPDFLVQNAYGKKEVVRLFPECTTQKETIAAFYISNKFMPARVRVLLDILKSSKIFN